MLWRHLCLVRAWSAAGLVSGLMILGASSATAQTTRPADPRAPTPPPRWSPRRSTCSRPSKAGDLNVVARGQGQDRVRLTIRNTSSKRLNVVVPPGPGRLGAPRASPAAAAASRAWAWA